MADDIWQNEWRIEDGRPEQMLRMAIIKLDPPSSKSTGGVVVDIEHWKYTISSKEARRGTQYINGSGRYEMNSDYKCIQSDDAQVGWILQDKTGILMDSNSKD